MQVLEFNPSDSLAKFPVSSEFIRTTEAHCEGHSGRAGTWISHQQSYQGGPHSVLVAAAEKDEKPKCGSRKTEDRNEHDPAQRVVRENQGGGRQDPHQTSKNLQAGREVSVTSCNGLVRCFFFLRLTEISHFCSRMFIIAR